MQLYLFKTFLGIFYVDIYQQMSTEKTPKNAKKTPKNAEYVCECGKFYSARNSLWYHKKKCKYIDNVDNKEDIFLN